jgi:hypothetical protein
VTGALSKSRAPTQGYRCADGCLTLSAACCEPRKQGWCGIHTTTMPGLKRLSTSDAPGQVLHDVLAREAAAGSGADSAVQLAALHALAAALSTPNARAALQQLVQQQVPERHAVALSAAFEGRPGNTPLLPTLQHPAVQRDVPAAGTAVRELQPALLARSDAASWRAPAASGDNSAAAMDHTAASAPKPQAPGSLAQLLLSTACGEHVQDLHVRWSPLQPSTCPAVRNIMCGSMMAF